MKRITASVVASIATSLACAQSYQINPGTIYQDFQDTTSWTSSDGTISADTTDVILGTKSLMLTAVPGSNAHARKVINTDFSQVNTISFWVYAQFPFSNNSWHAASIYLTSDGYQDYFLATTQQIHPGWSKLTFSKSDFQAIGNPSWTPPMTNMQLALFGDTTGGMSLSFADMELNAYYRPKVIIAFDDNYQSSYDFGYQYLKKYGLQGTEFVISSTVNGLGRATTGELQEMYNYGWDMCNHTTTHPDLRTLTQAQIVNEYQTCANFLVSNGWVRNNDYLHLAYPYGDFNSTVLAADQQFGILTARTTMKTLPQADLLDSQYFLYSQVPDSTSQSVSDILASVNQVVSDGGALILTFHNITPTPQVAIDWKDTDFEAIIDQVASLRSQGLLDVVTLTQWYAGLQAPAPLSYFKANAPQVASGINNTGLVYLSAPAPYAETVSLSTTSPLIQIPPTVTVAAGSSTASFGVGTLWVSSSTVVSMSASLNGTTMTCSFTIVPKAPRVVLLDSTSVKGGSSTTGHVWLNAPSPAGGCYVAISSSTLYATVSPTRVFIPEGWFHGDFTVRTARVFATKTATIKATYNGGKATATLTITP